MSTRFLAWDVLLQLTAIVLRLEREASVGSQKPSIIGFAMAGNDSPSKNSKLPETEVKACAASPVAKDPQLSSEVCRGALDDGSLAAFYKPIDTYEGRHRYDPNFEWGPAEEKRLVRKIDYRICTWVCLMFFALQLDRGNISQALSDNLLDDLGLTTNDYNTGQTIFYLTFLFAELPSQLISKKIGPDNWIRTWRVDGVRTALTTS